MRIVSTKIPFKGTGKEYIGDDITEIASAVKVLIGDDFHFIICMYLQLCAFDYL